MATVAEFFKGRDIFITGGSGFMGKVLIEKLLRSCGELNKIFILIRAKKGKSSQERIAEIIQLPLFDSLRESNPSVLQKIEAINGDVTLISLGLSEKDLETLKNVSVIFHAAASVRFDDPLKDAIILNTRGTLEVMKFAENLKNIKVVLHVSTTYCYPDRHEVEEKLYPPYADWKSAIKIAERFDTESLNILNAKYSSYQPNTYTFTKNLAEHVINDYKEKLPLVLFRPSIVISTLSEPVPGWIDNFNGPVGIFVASGLGIIRTMHGDPDIVSDYMPVDIAIKGMIMAAYKRGIEEKSSELTIYNSSTSATRAFSTGYIIDMAKQLIWESPLERTVWAPGGYITKCRVNNYLRFMVYHVLTACLLDSVLRLLKYKPFLLKVQRKIYAANLALHYFATTTWTFHNDNFVALDAAVPKSEFDTFAYHHLKDCDVRAYFLNALLGAKKYLLKESPNVDIEWSKKKLYILNAIDKTLTFLFYIILVKLLVKFNILGILYSFINKFVSP